MKKSNTQQAVWALEKIIKDNWGPDPPSNVKVYHYIDRGFRISEISATWGMPPSIRGCSWMRVECPSLILAAEQFVLTYGTKPYRPKGWESDIDNHAESEDAVIHHLK